MALIDVELSFNNLNQSLQIGDIAYFATQTTNSGFILASSNLIEIGPVTNISGSTITESVDETSEFISGFFDFYVFSVKIILLIWLQFLVIMEK